MEELDDDLLGHIFGMLGSSYDKKSCSRVCSQWRRVEGTARRHLNIIDPLHMPSFMPRYTNVKVLVSRSFSLCDSDMELIAQSCPLVRVLNLNIPKTRCYVDMWNDCRDTVTDQGMVAIAANCKQLRELHLTRRCEIGVKAVSAIVESCHGIEHLDLAFCNRVNNRALEAVARAPSLRVLVLQGCSLVSDEGLGNLVSGPAAKTLTTLDLSHCDTVTDTGVRLLSELPRLTSLNLSLCGTRITDDGVAHLGHVTTLESLYLCWLKKVSDACLVAIAQQCQHLRQLHVSGCEAITGDGIFALTRLESLRVLVMDALYRVPPDEIEQTLLGCPKLEYIGIDRWFRDWISPHTLDRIQRSCQVEWL